MIVDRILHRVWRRARRMRRRNPAPTVWYHNAYHIPVEGLGLETGRSDLVAWSLLDLGIVSPDQIVEPVRVPYAKMAAVHSESLLQALSDPKVLAPIFGASPEELSAENIVRTIRFAAGATLMAARRAASGAGPQVNLLGGFHHASPERGGGFSVVNDIAVALAALRQEGLTGTVGILDLDAHQPDGTADCINSYPELMGDVFIGSLSGSSWGELEGVDETLLTGADDDRYLAALEALLARMPKLEFAFVVAGGDVLKGDRFGGLSLSVDGAYRRDRRVAKHLKSVPSVWLSAGGYSSDAWKVLLNTVAALALYGPLELPKRYDPVRARYSKVARKLRPPEDSELLSEYDLGLDLGFRPSGGLRLLGVYTPEWIEYALYRFGLLEHCERLGYSKPRIDLERAPEGDRLRVYASAPDASASQDALDSHEPPLLEHVLLDFVVDRLHIDGEWFLFVNWLTLRHPIAHFTKARPKLPNQDVPGLGLAKEAGEILLLMAIRLNLAGVSIRPAAFHVAYTARYEFSFADPARQGRFVKLIKDLGHIPLADLTRAIADKHVLLDGQTYDWEADVMIVRRDGERTVPIECKEAFTLVS